MISASQLEPIFLRSLDQLEDLDPCFVAGQTALRLPGTMADCSERAFNGVCCADVAPMFGWEVVKTEQWLAVFHQTGDSLFIFGAVFISKMIKRDVSLLACEGLS